MTAPPTGDGQVEDRRAIVRDSLGVGIATGLYGVSFGAVSVASGLSVLQTCALSLLMFTGASQFALVGVVAGGGSARRRPHRCPPPPRGIARWRRSVEAEQVLQADGEARSIADRA